MKHIMRDDTHKLGTTGPLHNNHSKQTHHLELALCHEVTLDVMTLPWVLAGHPQSHRQNENHAPHRTQHRTQDVTPLAIMTVCPVSVDRAMSATSVSEIYFWFFVFFSYVSVCTGKWADSRAWQFVSATRNAVVRAGNAAGDSSCCG